jgi:hypothetical protein
VTISGGGQNIQVLITQNGNTSSDIQIIPGNLTLTPESGTHTAQILTACNSWFIDVPVPWLSVSPLSGSGNIGISLNYTANTSPQERTATLTISGCGQIALLTVSQAGQQPGSPPWGAPLTSNLSGTLLGQAQINGIPAAAGDWVGAFDENNQIVGASEVIIANGLAYINLVIYGDDPNTSTVDEGLTSTETFRLALFDISESKVFDYPFIGAPTYLSGWVSNNGAPMPNFNDPTVIYNFEESSVDVIPLAPGWNLISTDLLPVDSTIQAVLGGLQPGNVQVVTGFNSNGANFYDPSGLPFLNTLHDFQKGFGYWIRVTSEDTLYVQGAPIAPDYFKPMDLGWNLIAYLPQSSQPPQTYLEPFINTGLEYVTGFDGDAQFYDPNGLPFLNSLSEMRNSRGYWVKMPGQALIDNELDRRTSNKYTNRYDFIGGRTTLEEGSQVMVHGEDGTPYGWLTILRGGLIQTMPIYGDAPETPEKEGPADGECLHFSWKGTLSPQRHVFKGNYDIHNLKLHFESETANPVIKVSPNPASTEVWVQFENKENEPLELELRSIQGKLLQTVRLEAALKEGIENIHLDISDYPPGTYIICLLENRSLIKTCQLIKQ